MVDDIDVKSIVRIVELRGSNKCEVEYANGEKMLSLIPTKFKKKVWIRKGDFAVTEGQSDENATSQVRTSIARFLDAQDIKDLIKLNIWPAVFTKTKEEAPKVVKKKEEKEEKEKVEKVEGEEYEDEDDDEDDDLFVNPNHQVYPDSDDEEEEEDEEDE